MYSKREEKRGRGRPSIDPDDDSEVVRKTVRLTENILKDSKGRIETHGDISKYIRYLIRRDLGKEPEKAAG